jgi:hypothetical protein
MRNMQMEERRPREDLSGGKSVVIRIEKSGGRGSPPGCSNSTIGSTKLEVSCASLLAGLMTGESGWQGFSEFLPFCSSGSGQQEWPLLFT